MFRIGEAVITWSLGSCSCSQGHRVSYRKRQSFSEIVWERTEAVLHVFCLAGVLRRSNMF